MPKVRVVRRHLRFAWVEYDLTHDGVAFHTVFTNELGWQNLMISLPVDSANRNKRKDAAHPDLDILWKMWRGKKGLLITPSNREITEFMENWVFSPGIKVDANGSAELTDGPDATLQAEIVGVGGHGGIGTVFSFKNDGYIDLGGCIQRNQGAWPSHEVRLKYLVIASCTNLAPFNVASWIGAFEKQNPIRGILGFVDADPGGAKGAILMIKFGRYLKAGTTVLDSWRKANEDLGWHDNWGALIHEDAKDDSMDRWIAEKLPPLKQQGMVRHYSNKSYENNGFPVKQEDYGFSVNFYMKSADSFIEISNENNNMINDVVGLFSGEDGYLSIRTKTEKMFPGETIQVVFYHWRPGKDDMDLTKLLEFHTSAIVRYMNIKPDDSVTSNHINGFEYTLSEGEESEIRLSYRIFGDSIDYYPRDTMTGISNESFGYFWVAIKPPRSPEWMNYYLDGAFLRSPSLPYLIYLDENIDELTPIQRDPELYRLQANTEYMFQFENTGIENKEITIYTIDGLQVSIDEIMNILPHSQWSLSPDRMSVELEANRNGFLARIHDQATIENNGRNNQEYFFRVEYIGPNGASVFESQDQKFSLD